MSRGNYNRCVMMEYIRSWANQKSTAENAAFLVIALLVWGALFVECVEFCRTVAFCSDDVLYIRHYPWREGRWLQVFFDPIVPSFNAKLIAMANVAGVLYFFWVAMCRVIGNRWAMVGAAVCVMAPPVHVINMWPLSTFPSIILLVVAAWAYTRMTKVSFFLLFGFLFSGCVAHFYFLLPLLFINENGRETFKTIIWWCIAYVLGFAFSELYVFVRTGQMIELIGWRQPHPVTCVADVFDNTLRAMNFMLSHLKIFSLRDMGYLSVLLPVLFWNIWRKKMAPLTTLPVLVMIAFSIYAQSVPAGVIVDLRSCLCLFTSLFFLCIWVSSSSWPFVAYFCFIVASAFHGINMRDMECVNTIRSIWYTHLKELNYKPEMLKGCVMLSDNKEVGEKVDEFCERLALQPPAGVSQIKASFSWNATAYELGFGYVDDVQHWLKKVGFKEGIDISDLQFEESPLYYHAVKDKYLFLKFK